MKKVLATLIAAAALTGCSAYTKGTFQTLHITTEPSKAICTVSFAGETPFASITSDGTVYNVRRGSKELNVLCAKDGYYDAAAVLNSTTDTEAYQSFVIPDMLIGTHREYPGSVHLDLRRI